MGHSSGGSWVYIFSQFTSEALYFEILAFLGLVALYAAFWILKKRRFGVVDTDVPPGVVRVYLNELIGDAERLRHQLFGLLAREGMMDPSSARMGQLDPALLQSLMALQSSGQLQAATTTALPASTTEPPAALPEGTTPEIQARFDELETKLKEQSQAAEKLFAERNSIQVELQAAKANAGTASPGMNHGELEELKKKIKALEGRLSEYSVIEDDLANLKRLQQENQALKQALEAAGGTAASVTAVATAAAPAATSTAPTAAPVAAAEVEAPPTASPSSTAAAPAAAAAAKNEDDLLAEFEKMLGT